MRLSLSPHPQNSVIPPGSLAKGVRRVKVRIIFERQIQFALRPAGPLNTARRGRDRQAETTVYVFSHSGVSGVAITVQFPDLELQNAFNVARWTEILADTRLANLPDRIETDRHGHIIMSPPPAPRHSRRQATLLTQLVPEGVAFTECPISTAAALCPFGRATTSRSR